MSLVYSLLVAIFLSALFAASSADVVNYNTANNALCATATGGCNFMTDIWTGAINDQAQIVIQTNEPITLLVNSSVTLSSLTFGMSGAQVNIVVSDAFINAGSFVWGGSSTLEVITGTLSGMNTVVNGSSLYGSFSIITAYAVNISNLYINNTQLNVQNLEISNKSVIRTAQVTANMNIWLDQRAIVEFYDTELDLEKLKLFPESIFAFYPLSAQITLQVDTVQNPVLPNNFLNSQIILGDFSIASFTTGTINHLTLGDNVVLNVGDAMNVYLVEQTGTTITEISVFGNLYLQTYAPILAQINVTAGSVLGIFSMLLLSPGSSITGEGQMTLAGFFHGPSVNVSVDVMYFADSISDVALTHPGDSNITDAFLIVQNLFANYLLFSSSGVEANVLGNVFVNNDFYISSNTMVINGTFFQKHGRFSVNVMSLPVDETTPRLQVIGEAVFEHNNVTIAGDDLPEKKKYLLIQSSKDLKVAGLVAESASLNEYTLISEKGGLYVEKGGKSNIPEYDSSEEPHHHHSKGAKIAAGILVPLCVIGVALGGYIFYRKKLAKKHHYDSI